MILPGLTDIHVHMRDPGATHKENWDTGTAAALAGGFTTVLAMPNTQPPVTDSATLEKTLDRAGLKARCDYGQYLGAGPDNIGELTEPGTRTPGLKMYLDQTYGSLRLDNMTLWMEHFAKWPKNRVISVHGEERTMAAAILMASVYNRPMHICHVSRREEILLIRAAKEKGIKITCEVCPHHLLLTKEDIPDIGHGRSEVRPRLASAHDRDALWENLDVIDVIATDHAPHTLAEKDSPNPPPGFPGLETALPLMLTAVYDGRLTLEDLITRMHTNPRQIFNLPVQPDTWIEVDPESAWEIRSEELFTKCGWTPFEGRKVRGRIKRVVLRGTDVFQDGKVIAQPGSGRNVF
ncbi:MAG: amidohydrolase family protein [Desulfobacterales bacterium]|nr:amidohydrolase family protein [Desulfobacterales bacterium]